MKKLLILSAGVFLSFNLVSISAYQITPPGKLIIPCPTAKTNTFVTGAIGQNSLSNEGVLFWQLDATKAGLANGTTITIDTSKGEQGLKFDYGTVSVSAPFPVGLTCVGTFKTHVSNSDKDLKTYSVTASAPSKYNACVWDSSNKYFVCENPN